MKRKSGTNELFKINLIMTGLVILGNIIIALCIKPNSATYTILNCYFSFSILFAYSYLLLANLKKNLLQYKTEVLYINYPLNIAIFFLFIFLILFGSMLCLLIVNKDAANTTAIFTFFVSTISMLMPSIVLLVLFFFISPAIIIPNLKSDKHSRAKYKNIFYASLIIYIIICLLNGIDFSGKFEAQNRYKSSKMTIRFSTESLKISENVKSYAQKLMTREKIDIPFFYTTDSFPFSKYEDAEIFCKAMNARVPNYLEAFHIAFNYFDTFGNKYYWTSDKDGQIPLVVHFKNMSYTVERMPKNVKPALYCVASAEENYGFKKKEYFYRDTVIEKAETEKTIKQHVQKDNFRDLEDLLEQETDTKILQKAENNSDINTDKKHVNFSVKEVSPSYMQQLINKGYSYNPSIQIRSEYEASETKIGALINKDIKNVRLCYYPFTEYGSLSMNQERQIWEQSFCSPAFNVLNFPPAYVANANKNTYCQNYGGRLPNIPELGAILRITGSNVIGTKFWTNNRISNNAGIPVSVAVYYQDERFMRVESMPEESNAYAYCVKKAVPSSKVIANYKSRFYGYDGSVLAKKICPNCYYYEAPDVIVRK